MNKMIKHMLEAQAKADCNERGNCDTSKHGFISAINYIESFELLTLEMSMAIDTDDKEELDRCHSEMITLCTVNNYSRS